MNSNTYNILLKYAKSIDLQNAPDLVHDAYLKIIDSGKNVEEIEIGYYILTIRSIFLDKYRKDKHQNTILYNDYNIDIEDINDNIEEIKKIDTSDLKPFEKWLIYSLFGVEVLNERDGIMEIIEGCNMLQLSKETKIPYITIRKSMIDIKNKLKKQFNEYKN